MRHLALLILALSISVPSAADKIDDYVRAQMAVRHLPGLSLAVVRDGRIVKSAGYGVASLELEVPATERTVYEIGSISKQIAANAILLLREDGKLQLDDLLSKYIDGLPAAWATLTIRHVLSHTGGLPDFDTGNIGFSYRRDYTTREFLDLAGAQPLAFKPGERWAYTNGFPLLGFVVERVTGRSYSDFVRERIFTRLGLASARFKVNGEVVPHRADGYLWQDGTYRHGEPLRPQVIAPNGGVMMNVLDFAAWDIAVSSGRLLSADSLKEMSAPTRLNDGRTVSHGLGWFVDTFDGHRFGAHWGATVTAHSAVIRRYDEGVTVIVMANMDDGGGLAVDAISKRVADMFLPGTAIQGLKPRPDANPGETATIRKAMAAIAAGQNAPDVAPGLMSFLPQRVKDRIAVANAESSRFEWLGDETLTPFHFNVDPAVVRMRRYRVTTADGLRFLTIRLSAAGVVHGVLVEDE